MSAAAVPFELQAVGELTDPNKDRTDVGLDEFHKQDTPAHAETQPEATASESERPMTPPRTGAYPRGGYIAEKLEMMGSAVKYLFGRAASKRQPTDTSGKSSAPVIIDPFSTGTTGASGLGPGYESQPTPVTATAGTTAAPKINDAVPSMPALPEPVLGQHHEGADQLGQPLNTGAKTKNALMSGVEKVVQESQAVHSSLTGPSAAAPDAAAELESFKAEDRAFHSQGVTAGAGFGAPSALPHRP